MPESPVPIDDVDESRRLHCLIEGESVVFTVRVSCHSEIGELKEVIQRTRSLGFLKDIDPHTLELWKVDVDLNDYEGDSLIPLVVNENVEGHRLTEWKRVGGYWQLQPADDVLDIIVKPPIKVQADVPTEEQNLSRIPTIDKRFESDYKIVALGKKHTLLEVSYPVAEQSLEDPSSNSARDPNNHAATEAIAREINILRKIRHAQCIHLPELVWEGEDNIEFGIVPLGKPIESSRPQDTSRRIVTGLVDGLKYLHSLNIIHRDIQPANLVLDNTDNVIIIDYETSVIVTDGLTVEYFGGFISWPPRLLEDRIVYYTPERADDLLAFVLTIYRLLRPSEFDGLQPSKISAYGEKLSHETARILGFWKEMEKSIMWGPYVRAAKESNYEELKDLVT